MSVVPLESAIVARIVRRLESEPGCYVFKSSGGPSQRRGLPDVLGCLRGRFFGLEVKRPTMGIVSESQKYELQQIANAGGLAFVVESLDDALDALDLA